MNNNIFQMSQEMRQQIDWINKILLGDDSDFINVNGVMKPSIEKSIADKFLELKSLMNGRLLFETKAELVESGQPSPLALADVWNDPVFENNGLFGWTGAAWSRSPMDMNVITALISNSANQRSLSNSGALIDTGLAKSAQSTDVYPLAVDAEGRILLGIDRFGNVIGDVTESARPAAIEELNKFGGANGQSIAGVIPFITDQKGQVLAGFSPTNGRIVCDIRTALSMSFTNDLATSTEDCAFYPLAVDANGRVLIGVDKKTGTLIAELPTLTYPSTQLESISKESILPMSDWNHIAFYGQSLSVGIMCDPAITTTAKYNSLTFIAGPKSTMAGSVGYNPGMDAVKPLIEDNLFGDMPKRYHHGETPCSGFSDGVIQLSAIDNGYDWQSMRQLFVNTAGLGSAGIENLLPGSSSHEGHWWLNLQHSVEQAHKLAVAEGKTYAFHALCWIQGEGNAGSLDDGAYDAYKKNLATLHAAVQSLSERTTGLHHKVAFLSYQTYARSGKSGQVQQAQLDYCNENENAYLATPIYHLPLSRDGHFNNVGSYLVGRYFARAYKKIAIDKKAPIWIKPISAVYQYDHVIIKYQVPSPPLVIDFQALAVTNDAGYRVIDDHGTVPISDITVIDNVNVKLTLDRQISGKVTVRYAHDYRGDGLVNYDNSTSGNVRDSEPETVIVNNKEYPLFNVAPHHSLNVITI